MNILILDDHPLFAEAMRQVLLRLGNQTFIQHVTNVTQALSLLEQSKIFDLILLDLQLPGLDGFSLLRILQERLISTPVIVVSASDNPATLQQVMRAGAMGYISKALDAKAMLNVVHHVMAGNPCFPDAGSPPRIHFSKVAQTPPETLGISHRQFGILQLMEKGLSNKEIADQLDIAEATVKIHVSKLLAALAVHNRLSCVMEAQRLGIL